MRRIILFSLLVFVVVVLFSAFSQSQVAFSAESRPYFRSARDSLFGDYFLFSQQQAVSLDLEGAPLTAVAKVLSEQTGLNFISTVPTPQNEEDPGITITAYLQEVPFKKAMDILFKANNLTYEYYPEANIFVIKDLGKPTPVRITRTYRLKHTRLSSSRIHSEIDTILERMRVGDDEGGNGSDGTEEKKCVESVVRAVAQSLDEKAEVVGHSNSNSLTISALPSVIPTLEELINRLDEPILQVMIEVEILDVSKEAVDALGVRYQDGISGALTTYAAPFSPSQIGSFLDSASASLTNTIIAELHSLDSTAKILARPRIFTMNNETAEINVIVDEVIGVDPEFDDEGNLTGLQSIRISDLPGDYKGSGVSLRVTPHVNPYDSEITLIVYPQVVDTSDSTYRDIVGNFYKNVEDRSVRSVARLRDGETLLLGGLIEQRENKAIDRIPFFSDIPLLGAFFRHKDESVGDRELLIFLTPRIVGRDSFVAQRREPSQLLRREQSDISRRRSISVALDSFSTR